MLPKGVVKPWDVIEVVKRANSVLWRADRVDDKELIKCGGLVVDLGK